MKIIETRLPGVVVFEPKVFRDQRGFFVETFRESALLEAAINETFVQDNHSRSSKGILRGLHYQLFQPQGKLVRVSRGKVFDVAVDVRKDSPTFGQWFGTILDDENLRMIYVPPGYAHGFVVLSEVADFIYRCTNYYHAESEQSIAWNDPDIGIEWPVSDVALSTKDQSAPNLSQQELEKLPNYSPI
ncbi:MAG: dTDP-4-dehydrorhamnose 3,5-epimerase [Nitrosomonas sp.]|uniref:dTDP-4-dehydrorhamnose 3,5-epimerase n=1 Tax=Nitrosomonas sp. TaxID=42353 RepID=UPI0025DC9E6D|nr:dTDP-4-dehydrorhamnose 3,5-epimerase [Nitrosomonas sp.]MBY0474169.1 dTDP-4-dehydrorhamnose 3,5-epimerase [Nitrosomonas sp.]